MGITEVTQHTFEEEVLGAKVPVMLLFTRQGDETCKQLEAVAEEVSQELSDQVKICKVDVDKEIMLALNYQVLDLPLLVFMNYGIFQKRITGTPDKATILETLQTLINLQSSQQISF